MKNLLHIEKKGSNQYRSKRAYHFHLVKFYIALAVIISVALYIIIRGTIDMTTDLFNIIAEAPTHKVYAAKAIPTSTEHELIVDYIKDTFGKDSDKAFQLLSCENSRLNPDAVNTAGNYPVGSRDIGVFQINEHWQAVQGKYLFNWKINIQIAKQIFDENDGQFNLWTCGRKLGI